VGGKVGVDFEGTKILLALLPAEICIYKCQYIKNPAERELKAGLAEVVKHGVIMDEEFMNI